MLMGHERVGLVRGTTGSVFRFGPLGGLLLFNCGYEVGIDGREGLWLLRRRVVFRAHGRRGGVMSVLSVV